MPPWLAEPDASLKGLNCALASSHLTSVDEMNVLLTQSSTNATAKGGLNMQDQIQVTRRERLLA
jgi:hypothetical protein